MDLNKTETALPVTESEILRQTVVKDLSEKFPEWLFSIHGQELRGINPSVFSDLNMSNAFSLCANLDVSLGICNFIFGLIGIPKSQRKQRIFTQIICVVFTHCIKRSLSCYLKFGIMLTPEIRSVAEHWSMQIKDATADRIYSPAEMTEFINRKIKQKGRA